MLWRYVSGNSGRNIVNSGACVAADRLDWVLTEATVIRRRRYISIRDVRRFEVRFVVMVLFDIFESPALSIVIRKETIGCG